MIKFLTLFATIFCFSFFANAQQLSNPSSTVYDAQNNRYFVANGGDGNINLITENGDVTLFKSGLSGVLSLAINNGVLYASDGWTDGTMIYGFDLLTSYELFSLNIPEAAQVNDLVFDSNGNLYVSDRVVDMVFKVDIQNETYEVFLTPMEVFAPNGMAFIAPDKLLIVSSSGFGIIYETDLNTGNTSIVNEAPFESLDGIAVDDNGNVYVSSWGADSYTCNLFYFPGGDFSQPAEIILSNGSGMGDFSYDFVNNKLVIPNWWENTVTFLELPFVNDHEAINFSNDAISVFPNPISYNNILNISSALFSDINNWECSLLNPSGKVIGKWELSNSDNLELNLPSLNISSGFKILLFESGDKRVYKKLIVH